MSEARSNGALPEPTSGPRASDDDRDRVVAQLREAAGRGILGLDELEERLTATYAARTLPELVPITADLPATTAPPAAKPHVPSVFQDDEFRHHFTVYALTIGMLIGIWALTGGGHFWPFYPAAGWGIAVGAHWQRASTAAKRRAVTPTDRDGEAPAVPTQVSGEIPERADDRPVRTFVVAVFVDIVRSTQLNEALGDEQWAAVRRAFRATVGDCVTAHGGWEANCSGDGVLARFETPQDAAAAAVQLLRRLDRQRRETGFSPSVRVGIHSGDAVDEDGDIIGNVVNLAARVTEAAAADEIVVTEHVADHLGASYATAGRGLHTLKGVGRPRHLLALDWR